MTGFNVQVFSNEYLPPGGTDVHAVVTVIADSTVAGAGTATPSEAVEVLVLDTSGSMQHDGRIREARRALAAAINQIRDGVWFSVVAGTEVARLAFPAPHLTGVHNGAVRANDQTRAQALEAVKYLEANGGTAMSTWLDAAAGIVSGFPGAIHHVLLVTDGKNESEPEAALDAALARYQGYFQCDTRGVGENWNVEELRQISQAFLGTVDIIPQPAEMAEEFAAIMNSAMGKAVADVALRVWTPQHAQLLFVKQVAPNIDELTAKARPGPNPLTKDFPTGAWGAEERDYHVSVRVNAAGVGEEMLAARISLVVDGNVVGQGLVKAMWSEDEQLTARINPEVAHYTGQQELAEAIHEGLAARQAGDEAEATTKLGRAVALAAAAGNDSTTRLLAKVVEVDNQGTVRLKKNAEQLDVMALDTRSTKTTRVRPGGPATPPAPPAS